MQPLHLTRVDKYRAGVLHSRPTVLRATLSRRRELNPLTVNTNDWRLRGAPANPLVHAKRERRTRPVIYQLLATGGDRGYRALARSIASAGDRLRMYPQVAGLLGVEPSSRVLESLLLPQLRPFILTPGHSPSVLQALTNRVEVYSRDNLTGLQGRYRRESNPLQNIDSVPAIQSRPVA